MILSRGTHYGYPIYFKGGVDMDDIKYITPYTELSIYNSIRGFATADGVNWILVSDIATALGIKCNTLTKKLKNCIFEKAYAILEKQNFCVVNSLGLNILFLNRDDVDSRKIVTDINQLMNIIFKNYRELRYKKEESEMFIANESTQTKNTLTLVDVDLGKLLEERNNILLAFNSNKENIDRVYMDIITKMDSQIKEYKSRIEELEKEVEKYKKFKDVLKTFITQD